MRQTRFTLGIAFWWDQIQATKEHRSFPFVAKAFGEVDRHTRYDLVLSKDLFTTDDPENVKAMLATNFSAWSIGQERINEMASYLGCGIFVNEGKAWRHSRDVLKPCFEESLVADVDMLKRHTQRLFALVPKDGAAVDLQPLLHDLSMDVATELLFGRSTNALWCRDLRYRRGILRSGGRTLVLRV